MKVVISVSSAVDVIPFVATVGKIDFCQYSVISRPETESSIESEEGLLTFLESARIRRGMERANPDANEYFYVRDILLDDQGSLQSYPVIVQYNRELGGPNVMHILQHERPEDVPAFQTMRASDYHCIKNTMPIWEYIKSCLYKKYR